MQDEIETARRRWAYIRPVPGQLPRPFESDRISHFLSEDVADLVRQLRARADFRELACAPITHLCRGPDTEEGLLIQRIDQALISTARNLLAFLERPSICQTLGLSPVVHPLPAVSQLDQSKEICLDDSSLHSRRSRFPQHVECETPLQRSLDNVSAYLAWIARHPWRSLTSASDYFGPNASFNLKPEARRQLNQLYGSPIPSQAEFIPFFQPRLQLPDDFVFSCFEIRVEHWRSQLDLIANQITRALDSTSDVTKEDRAALSAARSPIQPHLDELRRLWCDGEAAAERRAAVRLIQIYAAYHPEGQLGWLGDVSQQSQSAHYFRDRIERRYNQEIAEVIAGALSTLVGMYRRLECPDTRIEEAARTHRLCVISGEQRREVYWEGELLHIEWDRFKRAWNLFALIAEQALRTGQGVSSIGPSGKTRRHARGDLNGLLPGSLSELIVGTATTSYRLNLAPADIYFGNFEEHDVLVSVINRQETSSRDDR